MRDIYMENSLQELRRMCRDVCHDTDTAFYRQLRFFRELEIRGFFKYPGFEGLEAEMEAFRKIMKHNEELLEKVLKKLREMEEIMVNVERVAHCTERETDAVHAIELEGFFESGDLHVSKLDKDNVSVT